MNCSTLCDRQARWKPKLEKIVAKVTRTFSRSFAKIGCAGEVALHMADVPSGGVDYSRCAINIKCVGALGVFWAPCCCRHLVAFAVDHAAAQGVAQTCSFRH